MTALWIDLDNSPHVPLFVPLIEHYRRDGDKVIVTARDHSQTIKLLEMNSLSGTFEVIGRHYGKNKIAKLGGTLLRAMELRAYIKKQTQPAVAISHGSRSMVLAARSMKIPVITMYDYEYTETRIFNRFSDLVLVPEMIPDNVLDGIGLPVSRREKYPGIKEELYTNRHNFDSSLRRKLIEQAGRKDHDDLVLVVLRPPASTANYHSDESEKLLNAVFTKLFADPKVLTVIVPRTYEQADELISGPLSSAAADSFLMLRDPVNGMDLAAAADVLISGGGTMNREAVLAGVPVYSIFAGRLGSLDTAMDRDGRLVMVRSIDDVGKINIERRSNLKPAVLDDRVESFIVSRINSYLK